ncbi:hypothetical protein [Flavobacterium aestivum]|uniref:hypothetical protein n=1 Tax=Flavobacterium aestivum TaxID=3003257 RepID=UPI002482EE9E|nr:hypothetical protein [Flavobacterium aestivum]
MKNKEAKSIFSSLENFSSIPPPELWDKIEAQLDEPKKKKRAIIWWSIAASLLVGLSVPTILYFKSNQVNGFERSIENDANSVVLQKGSHRNNNNNNNNINEKNIDNENKNANEKGRNIKENNGVANTDVKINDRENNLNGNESFNDKKNNASNGKLNKNSIHLNNNTNQVAEANILNTPIKAKEQNLKLQKNNKRNAIVVAESKVNTAVADQNLPLTVSTSKLVNAKDVQTNNSNANNKVAVSNENDAFSGANINKVVTTKVTPKSVQANNINANSKSVVSSEKNIISESNVDKVVSTKVIPKSAQVNNLNANDKSVVGTEKNIISESNNNKGIAVNTSSKDSLDKIKKEVAQLENALAQLDKDKTTKKKDPESIDKWSLQVFAGVMSSQNYNNAKSLGNTIASKQSNGYGVKTNYKLNKKWGVSSGFKINELGQKIAGVSYYNKQSLSSAVSVPIANDNYVPNPSTNYQFVSITIDDEYLFASSSKKENGLEKGDVTQNLKYFEMPLEVSYALLSKKKTNIIMNTGGFVGKLISNDIALDGNSIGENKNVNQYVYGTLLSSTLQYEFYKKTKVFVEPGMNYYINPLENQSFNQFQWMFNVGLNVSF